MDGHVAVGLLTTTVTIAIRDSEVGIAVIVTSLRSLVIRMR